MALISRPLMKELALEPCAEDLTAAAEFLDNLDFTKVKTKYTKGCSLSWRDVFSQSPSNVRVCIHRLIIKSSTLA